jgi:hypothetical protein
VKAALSSPDPERRDWAAKEAEQIAVLDALSGDEFYEAILPSIEAACRDAGII